MEKDMVITPMENYAIGNETDTFDTNIPLSEIEIEELLKEFV